MLISISIVFSDHRPREKDVNEVQMRLTRELYYNLFRLLGDNPRMSDVQGMTNVAKLWYDTRRADFTELLKLYAKNNTDDGLWGVPIVTYEDDGSTKHTTQTLLPFDKLALGIERFGDGDSFFDIFEYTDAGLRDPWTGQGDAPDDAYHRLVNLMERRSRQLST